MATINKDEYERMKRHTLGHTQALTWCKAFQQRNDRWPNSIEFERIWGSLMLKVMLDQNKVKCTIETGAGVEPVRVISPA